MARYIKQHRRQIAGFAVPVFFLFLVGFLSFSIFPGWLKPTYGVPGAACSVPDGIDVPFSPDCDICNGELCTVNPAANSSFQCGVLAGDIFQFLQGTTTTFSPDFSSGAQGPQCPNGLIAAEFRVLFSGNSTNDLTGFIFPACYTECTPTLFTTMLNDTTVSFDLPSCGPSNTFCEGITGGDTSNECRTAVCVVEATPDATGNPTGCDFDYVDVTQNEDCQLCTDATEAGIPACGNGVCEVDEGEDCSSCAVDCLLPGFEANCPLTSGAVIDAACTPPTPTPTPVVVAVENAIIFPQGYPTLNFPRAGVCEDGDLCTDNACSADGSTCEATAKLASGNNADFCCPAGAVAPDSGSCGDLLGSNCDIDCYVPGECAPNVTELSGNCISSLTGQDGTSTATGAWFLLALAALSVPVVLRKRG